MVASAVSACGAPASPVLTNEFIYLSAPFPECHASTIVETSKELVAAWFGGTGEKHKDVGIWESRLEKNGWTEPREIADGVQTDGTRFPCWNPVLFQPSTGSLMLFYKVGPSPDRWWGLLKRSNDGGRSWSEPQRLPEGVLGPIKDKPVELKNGDILCGSSTEDKGWRIHFERTADRGKTWNITESLQDSSEFGAIQPTILFHPGNKLQALSRTRQGKICQAWSEDQGRTWSKMTPTSLPNPNSGIDAVTLKDGRQLLVYNHTTTGRSPLNVAISTNGHDWTPSEILEKDRGEYSYPAVIQASDGIIHITYTWKRQRIKHVSLDASSL
jgi:predicted neuraminidase